MTLLKLAALGGAAALGAAAYAFAHGGDASRVHACVTGEGQPILLSSPNGTCSQGTPLDWALQGPAGAPGPAGQRGPEGPRGEQGPPGESASTRVTTVRRSKSRGPGAGTLTVVAPCPKGTIALTGGFAVSGDSVSMRITRSAPLVSGSRPTGWVAVGLAGRRQSGWKLEATAVCARS